MLKKERKGLGNKEEVRGFCTSLGCRIEKSQKNLFLPPTAEKSRHRSAYIHTLNNNNNSNKLLEA